MTSLLTISQSPFLIYFGLRFSSRWFLASLSVPHQTDGPRAVQGIQLPAVAHTPAVYHPYQVPLAQECWYMIYFLTELKSLTVTKSCFSFTGTVWHCPTPVRQQS